MKAIASTLVVLFCAVVFAQQPQTGKTTLSIPGVKGVLQLDVGPTTWKITPQTDRKLVKLDTAPRPDRLQVTAFLWQVGFPASADRCRDELWRSTMNQVQVKRENLQQTDVGQTARVEYMIPEYNGAPVRQKNVHEYLGSRDLCAEVRVAKILFTPADQKLFDDVLNSVQLLPDEAGPGSPQPNPDVFQGSKSFFFDGTMAYLDKDFATAADLLQKALDEEKQKRTIGHDDFRALIDNLAISYRFINSPAKAKEALDYGLSQDPQYPLFHYDMACYYGSQRNMNKALDELRLTYQYKGNLSPSDHLSDPLSDSCFGKFLRDKKFVKAVQEMQGPQGS
jgi:hypothetical protein